jgi:hypothetical protein
MRFWVYAPSLERDPLVRCHFIVIPSSRGYVPKVIMDDAMESDKYTQLHFHWIGHYSILSLQLLHLYNIKQECKSVRLTCRYGRRNYKRNYQDYDQLFSYIKQILNLHATLQRQVMIRRLQISQNYICLLNQKAISLKAEIISALILDFRSHF